VYAILSPIYPPSDRNPNRISHYLPYVNTLNITGLIFPLPVRDVPKFKKKLNPTIGVNVLCEGDNEGFVPIYISKERNRRHHVNLFLLEGTDEQGHDLQHYVYIKSMSRLVAGRTSSTNKVSEWVSE